MITENKPRPICTMCRKNPCKKQGTLSVRGYIKYYSICSQCSKKKYNDSYKKKRKVAYRATKKPHCEECGFVAVMPCQLDVDHMDGNRYNNNLTNLRTLCANCHRLKTYLERL